MLTRQPADRPRCKVRGPPRLSGATASLAQAAAATRHMQVPGAPAAAQAEASGPPCHRRWRGGALPRHLRVPACEARTAGQVRAADSQAGRPACTHATHFCCMTHKCALHPVGTPTDKRCSDKTCALSCTHSGMARASQTSLAQARTHGLFPFEPLAAPLGCATRDPAKPAPLAGARTARRNLPTALDPCGPS